MYGTVETLCHTPETNTALYVNSTGAKIENTAVLLALRTKDLKFISVMILIVISSMSKEL